MKSPTMEFQGEADGSTHMSSSSGVYDINARQFDMTGRRQCHQRQGLHLQDRGGHG
ncbi:MAG: hypothetical protein WDN06_06205 [Asticcacaulis sp.]